MTETTLPGTAQLSFAPGSPNWVDLSSPDPAGSRTFYSGLFGWQPMDLGEDAGGYVMFTLDGRIAAAVGAVQEGAHPAWSVYFCTPDADATAAAVTAAGGQVIVPPFDVMDQGRMAVFGDPTGAFFSVWQPAKMVGLGIKDAANAFGWCELNTRGVDRAAQFYGTVFGWKAHRPATSTEGMPYTEWQLDGQSFGGAMDMADSDMAEDVPPHWLVYFNSPDIDAAVARVRELGGRVMMEPQGYPGGKFAVVGDPSGTPFGLMSADR
jgi:predicted enzyme related to lactoylglutathione lyase